MNEGDGNRLERQNIDRKLVHEVEVASKDRWGVLWTRKGGQRRETRMFADIYYTLRSMT